MSGGAGTNVTSEEIGEQISYRPSAPTWSPAAPCQASSENYQPRATLTLLPDQEEGKEQDSREKGTETGAVEPATEGEGNSGQDITSAVSIVRAGTGGAGRVSANHPGFLQWVWPSAEFWNSAEGMALRGVLEFPRGFGLMASPPHGIHAQPTRGRGGTRAQPGNPHCQRARMVKHQGRELPNFLERRSSRSTEGRARSNS